MRGKGAGRRLAAGFGIAGRAGGGRALDPAPAADAGRRGGRRVLDGRGQLELDRVVEPDLVGGDGAGEDAAVVQLDRGVRRVDHSLEAGGVVEQDVALALVCVRRVSRWRAEGRARPRAVVARAVHEHLYQLLPAVLVELVAVLHPERA